MKSSTSAACTFGNLGRPRASGPGQPCGPPSCSWYSELSVCGVPHRTSALRNRLRMHDGPQKLSPSAVSCQDRKGTRGVGNKAGSAGRVMLPGKAWCLNAKRRTLQTRQPAGTDLSVHGAPAWSNAVESGNFGGGGLGATLGAIRLSFQCRGRTLSGWASPWECRCPEPPRVRGLGSGSGLGLGLGLELELGLGLGSGSGSGLGLGLGLGLGCLQAC